MIVAGRRAVRQKWIELLRRQRRNGNVGRQILKADFQGAEAQRLPRQQHSVFDWLAINERAVGGSEVANPHRAVPHDDFAVPARNRRIVEAAIVCWIASEPDDTGRQFNGLRGARSRTDG